MATRTTESLAVETRTHAGTTAARALRHAGKIPGVLFGHGRPATPVSVDGRAFEELLHAGRRHHLLTITVDGGAKDTALIREIQRDPISRRVIHADFQRVGRSETISTTVPVSIVGVPPGVREFGGVLDVVTRELEVTGPADRIPEHVEVDVSQLGLREHLTAAEIALPAGFTLATSPDAIVVSVEPPRTVVEEAPPTPVAGEIPTVAETETGAES
jgi:large subunit ribosomal protein L25